ncbi:MFS transporter [Kitasatospora sp. NPDC059571]|uniref:MFS transporter n=1 Tax=Kitasatospora sp. NPDC059571 TaxID=3346871 RepID=UPI003677950D
MTDTAGHAPSGLAVLSGAHRNIKLRLAVAFVNRFLNYMLTPLMAIYLSSEMGVGRVGSLLALVVVATVCCTFLGGHLADTRGRRYTLLVAEGGVAAGYTVMALANSLLWHSPLATYGGFLLLTCMGGLAFPANDSVLMDVATPEIRTGLYTINYWSMNVSFAAGAAIGGLFYGRHFPDLLWAGAALSCGVLVVTFLGLAETAPALGRPGTERSVRATLAGFAEAARDRLFLRIVAAATLITLVEMQLTYYLGVRLSADFPRQELVHLGSWAPQVDGVQMLSILRILNTVLVVLLALLVKRVLSRISESLGMNLGIVLFVLGFMGLCVSNDAWVLIALSVVYTVGELLNVPARQAVMADVIDPRKRARYMSLYALRIRGAALLASATLPLGDLLGPYGMAVLFAACGLASLALLSAPARQRGQRLADFQKAMAADAGTAAVPTAATQPGGSR